MSATTLPKCVLAAINFKGGTGKTTVAIALAEGLCHFMKKRIVIVDCDFQGSASIALLGRKSLNGLIAKGATVDCQLEHQIASEKGLHLSTIAVKARHSVREAAGLIHVVPSNPDMPRRERQILACFMQQANIHAAYEAASRRIADLFRSLLDEFDIVLIDCPSGLTLFSEAAIKAADGLIIPTLPNEISIAAIDHLRAEIARARPERTLEELLVGTVVSKLRQRGGSDHYRYQTQSIENLLDRVAPEFQILRPYLPYCRELESATWRDGGAPASFGDHYGQSSAKVEQLVHELAVKCEAHMARQLAT
jgi:chromosome partitioning protein